MRLHPVFVALPLCAALLACSEKSTLEAAPSSAGEPRPAAPSSAAANAPAAAPAGKGAVEGKISVAGRVPQQPKIRTHPGVARVCGTELDDQTLLVDAAGGLQDAVVYVADAPKDPNPGQPTTLVLDQRKCAFAPAVIAARAGTEFKILNSDPLVHNVRAVQGQDTWINVAMPLEGMTLKRMLPPAPGTWKVHCDVHPWMRGALRTFDHDLFTLTTAGGKFRIEGVPAGKHTLGVWHPRFGEQKVEVEVAADGNTTADASWTVEQLQAR